MLFSLKLYSCCWKKQRDIITSTLTHRTKDGPPLPDVTVHEMCLFLAIIVQIGPGVALWLRRCTTSQTVPGSISGGVTGDFFHGTPDRTMCSEVDSASESEYQGFLLG